ncbi:MAG TPA: BON domain-containing protein [Terriglobia bacterium]|nr:BON domain-containing protein [Terriglobia bacterium]
MTKAAVFDIASLRKSVSIWSCLALLTIFIVPAALRADTGRSNGEITAGVQSRLYKAGLFKHGQVNVQVNDGVATLTGNVESYAEKMRAERAAKHQDGVQQVVNNIEVNTQDIGTQQILAQARHQVVTYPNYTIFDHITLSATGNQLTIGGEVTQPYKKSTLGNILGGIKGVADLQNNIKVLPTSGMDDQIRLATANRIYRDPMFTNYANQANPPIHIVVENGKVSLYGVVNSKAERQKADMDARFASINFGVKNNLRVSS